MTRHHAASFSNLLQSLTSFGRGVTGEPPFDGLQPVILFLLTWFADFSVFGWRVLFKNQANQHANVNVCEWKAPKTTLILENYTFEFRNIYVLMLKQCCLTCETQVFDSSNNIVSPPQTILFRPWKSNLRKRKCKKCRFRSLEGEWCQQIGRFHSARYNLRPVSGGRDYDPTDFPEEHLPRRTGDKVYFANRSRMPRNPRNCIWMRGKALWRPLFDKMSTAVFRCAQVPHPRLQNGIPAGPGATKWSYGGRRFDFLWNFCRQMIRGFNIITTFAATITNQGFTPKPNQSNEFK